MIGESRYKGQITKKKGNQFNSLSIVFDSTLFYFLYIYITTFFFLRRYIPVNFVSIGQPTTFFKDISSLKFIPFFHPNLLLAMPLPFHFSNEQRGQRFLKFRDKYKWNIIVFVIN